MYGFGQRSFKPTSGGTPKGYMRTATQQRAYDQRNAYLAKARQLGVARARTTYRGNLQPETKYFDTGINVAVTTAGTTWADTEVPCDNYVNASGSPAAYTDCCLIPTAQGTGYGQVVGTKYKLKRLRIKGALYIPVKITGTTVLDAIPVRLVLVMDTQPPTVASAGTQAQGEEVFQDFGASEENEFSFLRMANGGGRFRILKDKLVTINPTTAANNAAATTVSVSFSQPHFKFNIAFKTPLEVQIRTGNATPAIAGVSSHNIFLLAYAYESTAATAVVIQAASRAYYCD